MCLVGSVVEIENGKRGLGALDKGLWYHAKTSGYYLGGLSMSGLKKLLYLR